MSTQQKKLAIIFGGFVTAIFGFILVTLFKTSSFQENPQINIPIADSVRNFDECAALPDSIIQESFPPTCVTSTGQRFTQPPTRPGTGKEQPIVTSPKENEVIKSPLTVTGTVPAGWMFEGSFPLTLKTENGTTLVQVAAKEKTPGSWTSGSAVEFTATLTFATTAERGSLIFAKDNPSGLPENDSFFELNVKFK